ncbi:LytR/AlgR family response regulator transcription factor [Galbibacter pacificus]|uniref:LytTR family DNA-binding domain-containing protein n=1 Tax=Galbibacter pacificus TaxID=2996052 RepID=A0ABT6FRM2_9FLAO|nr:LytTR family DNA-binding domain-containing protein [Galbibacter pacificus]MDG3581827.1 LytTR family DNA-binding domain-containing protein [Galbibacter pacificus]MDG3585699.1 LytTR family DNA-binding domain-containing protein [Galbibacter pacificus]
MIRCLAIDDEKLSLDLLVDNIRRAPYLQLIARCKNTYEAAEVLQYEEVDLIFLDIQMPGLNGLQFLKTLTEPPMVILVTAYEQYALDGFALDVVDYLIKPVALERFIKACNKAKSLYDLRQAKANQSMVEPPHFFVNVEYSLVKIIVDDIRFVEGMKDYIKIHLDTSERPVITRMSLKAIIEKLPAELFVRIHKSYIVCVPKVTSIKRDFVLIGHQGIPIGESHKENVTKILGGGKH